MGKSPASWKEELSDRVGKFRRRRAGLQPDSDPAENLELDFEDPGEPAQINPLDDALGIAEDKDSVFDLEISDPAIVHGGDGPPREILSFEEPAHV